MNKILWGIILALFPALVLAADNSGSLSFAPPPSDYSVLFLGNIFGIVDGVLHGSGSQIMGAMFSVFNSAVLALGGIVIMYTLLVSTLNTAHEGQMLGQKWSSIWVPVRSALGLALLIPKASGYCLMQIFVMWVVVQGVGAADKVWNAALSYLNRGGLIVQEQIKPMKLLSGDGSDIAKGASTILSGQVCMYALQTILQNTQQGYLSSKQQSSGPCSGYPSKKMSKFCESSVPDFLSTVDFVQAQKDNKDDKHFSVTMPNFSNDSDYAFLNGICGTITWNALDSDDLDKVKSINSLQHPEIQTVKMSRAQALQQMYSDLSTVAQVMVTNDPQINKQKDQSDSGGDQFASITSANAADTAVQQFGVPYLTNGTPCTGPSDNCMMWGPDPTDSSTPLFNGTEFLGAVTDYDGIMQPTLNLIQEAQDKDKAEKERKFIEQASAQGWLLAGSYFIDLAKLNSSTSKDSDLVDQNTGLGSSSFNFSVHSVFGNNNDDDKTCQGTYKDLCVWLQGDSDRIKHIVNLIDGSYMLNAPIPQPDLKSTEHKALGSPKSNTVYGFIDNSAIVNLPNEHAIITAPKFGMKINIDIDVHPFYLKPISFPCGKMIIVLFTFCLGALLGDIFYNVIILGTFNFFLSMVGQIINTVIITFISVPLQGMAIIFQNSVKIIEVPSVNPVIALANMGVNYINFANDLWLYLTEIAIISVLIPWFGIFVMPLLSMVMPLILAWMSTMLSIGFITSYYIPFVPYIIFTFGSIGWLMAVIEAMVAAPIVALGVTHPEGEGPFGKGEQAIMILMNVFLRPALMIIGYIAAIALSYVSVWIINAGFANVVSFIQGDGTSSWSAHSSDVKSIADEASKINQTKGYTGWAGIYAMFFSILVYTSLYVTVVQKAFTLIVYLPDKVLRWIGGQPESIGTEAAGWAEDTKKQVSEAGDKTSRASKEMSKQLKDMFAGDSTESKADVSASGEG